MLLTLLIALNLLEKPTYYSVFPEVKQAEIEVVEEETLDEMFGRICSEEGFSECNKLKKIAECESGLDPSAYNGKNTNGSNDAGLMQINSIHGIGDERFNPEFSIRWAIHNYNNARPWNSSKHCWNKLLNEKRN